MPPKQPQDAGDEPSSAPPSPRSRPSRQDSRNPSDSSLGRSRLHAPLEPSRLRASRVPSSSPDPRARTTPQRDQEEHGGEEEAHAHAQGRGPSASHPSLAHTDETAHSDEARGDFLLHLAAGARTRLLDHDSWDAASGCGSENCKHGSFSPRALSPHKSDMSYGSTLSDTTGPRHTFGGHMPGVEEDDMHGMFGGDAVSEALLGGGRGSRMSTTRWLAERYFGVQESSTMYIAYYVPFLNWIGQYRWAYLRGDLIAALTVASFYIPMSLSYAENLAHVQPINGLYSFVFNPLIYAFLGTCPLMVVGPEAAGSLLTGQLVRENIQRGKIHDEDGFLSAEIAGMVTFMAGVVIFCAGIFRLGFLDNVLSRPFLRGFISAIGIVIFIDQLIPELGLDTLAGHAGGVAHGSCLDKAMFVVENIAHAHGPTAAVSFGAFGIIMVSRKLKHHLQQRYPNVAYIPDRFLVVVLSAVFAWRFDWASMGVPVLGNIHSKGRPFCSHWPLSFTHLKYSSDAFSTAFVIALLGFFESSVAAKSLGTGESKSGLKNVNLSANRELVALGAANMAGGLFMSLPAFGGYGRSKVNASTGGRTPMSSVFLSLITLICILFLLPYFYYIPKGVLSAMISIVAYSLLEEAPSDLHFFWQIRGWSELLLMLLIFMATIFWNLKIGIAVGIGLSLLRVIRHSTRPRIQILGRVQGTTDKFENAEAYLGDGERLEFVEGCLIVKIPEPLTFANTGDLKARLRRLEHHGSPGAHPALPRARRDEQNKNIVFDVHGVTGLDGAGAQVLRDIVAGYRERSVRVIFCRVPAERSKVWRLFVKSGIVDLCGGRSHFVSEVEEALKLTELEELREEFGMGREGLRHDEHWEVEGDPASERGERRATVA